MSTGQFFQNADSNGVQGKFGFAVVSREIGARKVFFSKNADSNGQTAMVSWKN